MQKLLVYILKIFQYFQNNFLFFWKPKHS